METATSTYCQTKNLQPTVQLNFQYKFSVNVYGVIYLIVRYLYGTFILDNFFTKKHTSALYRMNCKDVSVNVRIKCTINQIIWFRMVFRAFNCYLSCKFISKKKL